MQYKPIPRSPLSSSPFHSPSSFRLSSSLLLPLLCTLLLCACRPAERGAYRVAEGTVWHTGYRITYRSDADLSAEILETMQRVEQSLSPFLTSSAISAINRGDSDLADSLIIRVWDEAMRVHRLSGGAFDPTVGPLVRLWGFGTDATRRGRPSAAEVDSCLGAVGFGECRREGMRIVRKRGDTQFDFSAITKGFGVDEVAATLRRHGVTDYLVEIGGELTASGVNPDGETWCVAIDLPPMAEATAALSGPADVAPAHGGNAGILRLSNCAVATSGSYRNYRDTEAGRISHIISPLTGEPVLTPVVSATVVAPTCMEADALATAMMALTPERSRRLAGSLPEVSHAVLIIADTTGSNGNTAGDGLRIEWLK